MKCCPVNDNNKSLKIDQYMSLYLIFDKTTDANTSRTVLSVCHWSVLLAHFIQLYIWSLWLFYVTGYIHRERYIG